MWKLLVSHSAVSDQSFAREYRIIMHYYKGAVKP